MTLKAAQRRALETQLAGEADAKNLRLVHRERTAGHYVWDAVDIRTGVVAVRGVSLTELEKYLRPSVTP
ncbi:MAG TPA: hypothetical protein VES79_09565 [Solirubrobacteraceae bacterium]|nr:hypothetical protein [Solirubrobacteraceae bacterium]